MEPQIRERDRIRRTLAILGWPGAAAVGGALIVAIALYGWLDSRIEGQLARNQYLTHEITKLDKEIAEIWKLKEQTAAVLALNRVVEVLDPRRPVAAVLLAEIARLRGNGIVLRSVIRVGTNVTISGAGASYLDVEAFIRRIGNSGYLEQPRLREVRTAGVVKPSGHAIHFTFAAGLRLERDLQETDPGAKPARTASGDPK